MNTVLRDVHFALRRLRGSPIFTIAATTTLALAIGATASVFGLVDGVLLKSYVIRDVDRVIVVWQSSPERHLPQFTVSASNFLDWRSQNTVFSDLAATSFRQVTVTGTQASERVSVNAVTPSFFRVMGAAPVLGRPLAQDSAGPPEVVISNGYWRRQFGGSPSVLGHTLIIADKPCTIVGVMPPGIPSGTEMWTRLSLTAEDLHDRGSSYLVVIGRLKPGVTIIGAQRDLETIAARLAVAFPATNQGWSVELVPIVDQMVGKVRPALLALMAAAGCVLLIGASNLANLFLVRGMAREHDVAVRAALGATRGRLVRELVSEAACLGLAAGALGVGIAIVGVRILRQLAPPTLPRLSEVGVDGRAVAFCAAASIATVLLFGVMPAFQVSRHGLAGFLKAGRRSTGSTRHHRLQDGLVVLQVVVALVLLTGAGLLVEGFDHFRRLDPGFRPDGVMTAEIGIPAGRYSTPERQAAFAESVVDALAAQHGVDAVSASSNLPGRGAAYWGYRVAGEPTPDPQHLPIGNVIAVTPGYFRTLGIPVRSGRTVDATDDSRARKVVVVDQLLARRAFGERDPIGQRLVAEIDTFTIVGVVATVKQAGLATADMPSMYVPLAQFPDNFAEIAVRASGDVSAYATVLRETIAGLDRTVPVSQVETMTEHMAQTVGTTRFASFLASLFAIVALILGAVGIYSVLAYAVTQRQRDIAVRLILGAANRDVMREVVYRALTLTLIGSVLGTAAAWILTRTLESIFLGVSPHDPLVFAGAAGLFACISLLAASIPAFRTTRVSPLVALREGL